MAPGAEIVIELEAKLLTEPKARPAIEPGVKPAMEPGAGPTLEQEIRSAETKELLVFIAFIIIINISSSGLHDLIKTYNNKK